MLENRFLKGTPTAEDVCEMLAAYYEGETLVQVAPFGRHPAQMAANAMAGRDDLRLYVCGNGDSTVVVAVFDNLGKGASGRSGAEHELDAGLCGDRRAGVGTAVTRRGGRRCPPNHRNEGYRDVERDFGRRMRPQGIQGGWGRPRRKEWSRRCAPDDPPFRQRKERFSHDFVRL